MPPRPQPTERNHSDTETMEKEVGNGRWLSGHQNRAGRVAHDPLGVAAENPVGKAVVAPGRHHDQVGVLEASDVADPVPDLSPMHLGRDGEPTEVRVQEGPEIGFAGRWGSVLGRDAGEGRE